MTADEFNAALVELGMSQRAFAGRVGTTHETVNRWARGKKPIPSWVSRMIPLLKTALAHDDAGRA